jgi:hypothetical protein
MVADGSFETLKVTIYYTTIARRHIHSNRHEELKCYTL